MGRCLVCRSHFYTPSPTSADLFVFSNFYLGFWGSLPFSRYGKNCLKQWWNGEFICRHDRHHGKNREKIYSKNGKNAEDGEIVFLHFCHFRHGEDTEKKLNGKWRLFPLLFRLLSIASAQPYCVGYVKLCVLILHLTLLILNSKCLHLPYSARPFSRERAVYTNKTIV